MEVTPRTPGKYPANHPAPDGAPPGARSACRPRVPQLTPGLLALLLLGAPPLSATQVYKWTDAEGHVHFGDRPDATAPAESMTIRTSPGDAAKGGNQDQLHQLLDDYARDRQQQDATRAAEERAREVRERRCGAARRQLQAAENANFLYDYTPAGERRVLDGAEYDAAIANARKSAAEACE